MWTQSLISFAYKSAVFFDRLFNGQQSVSEKDSVPYGDPRVAAFMTKFISMVSIIPSWILIPSTIYNHYFKGPAGKSWSLRENLFITLFRYTFDRFKYLTVEQIQLITTHPKQIIPPDISCRPFIVPRKCREVADDMVSKQFSTSDREKLDWNLKMSHDKVPDLKGEWLQEKKNGVPVSDDDSTLLFFHGGAYFFGSYTTYRNFLFKIVKGSKRRTCAIDYRLSPQYPFPSALEDAMAAYLYLIDPPKDSGEKPIDPKKIVVSGDSSGGGLSVALLMAIRDAGLPSPGGAVVFSPLLDLTYSLPSVVNNILTDFLPPMGHWHAPSPAAEFIYSQKINEYNEKEDDKDAKVSLPSKDDRWILKNDYKRIHYYAPNCGVKLPLVSPAFDKKCLWGLPNILIQCGDGERLRDESLYAALTGTGQFLDKTQTKVEQPTRISLELYEDQPHDFQFLVKNKLSKRAIQNTIDFFINHSSGKDDSKSNTEQVKEDLLAIFKITPDGKSMDIKEEVMAKFTKERYDEWNYLLSKTSIKERFDYVDYCCDLVLNGKK